MSNSEDFCLGNLPFLIYQLRGRGRDRNQFPKLTFIFFNLPSLFSFFHLPYSLPNIQVPYQMRQGPRHLCYTTLIHPCALDSFILRSKRHVLSFGRTMITKKYTVWDLNYTCASNPGFLGCANKPGHYQILPSALCMCMEKSPMPLDIQNQHKGEEWLSNKLN